MVGSFFVEIGENKVEHLRIPASSVAFNAIFDILDRHVSVSRSASVRGILVYLW
jgi:hypothetical protein